MKNGPLSNFLFEERDIQKAKWENRAKWLLYLHEEYETHIIHCDIKPQKILLDEKFHSENLEFRLRAKLMKKNQIRIATIMIRGTMGFMMPKGLKNAAITKNSRCL